VKYRKATPRTIEEAISNGLADAHAVIMGREEADDLADEVKDHVIDFIAQKFTVYVFDGTDSDRFAELFEKITGRKVSTG
jgi:hypothetical protein